MLGDPEPRRRNGRESRIAETAGNVGAGFPTTRKPGNVRKVRIGAAEPIKTKIIEISCKSLGRVLDLIHAPIGKRSDGMKGKTMKIFENQSWNTIAMDIIKNQRPENAGILVVTREGGGVVTYLTDSYRLFVVPTCPLVSIPTNWTEEKLLRVVPKDEDLYPEIMLPDVISDLPKVPKSGKVILSFVTAGDMEGGPPDITVILGFRAGNRNYDARYIQGASAVRFNRRERYSSVFFVGAAKLVVMPVVG